MMERSKFDSNTIRGSAAMKHKTGVYIPPLTFKVLIAASQGGFIAPHV